MLSTAFPSGSFPYLWKLYCGGGGDLQIKGDNWMFSGILNTCIKNRHIFVSAQPWPLEGGWGGGGWSASDFRQYMSCYNVVYCNSCWVWFSNREHCHYIICYHMCLSMWDHGYGILAEKVLISLRWIALNQCLLWLCVSGLQRFI